LSINILLWHWGRRGGGPRYTLELARVLTQESDFKVHLSLSHQSDLFDETAALGLPGFHIDTYTDKRSAALACLRVPRVRQEFRNYLMANRIDVVNCTMSHLWNAGMVSAIRKAGGRYLLTLHDATPHPGENYLVRQWLLRREVAAADALITLTRHVQDELCRVYGVPKERIAIAPHGVFQYGPSTGPRKFPHNRPFRLLFFGRVLPYKGLDLLLTAFEVLRREFPDLELVIAGQGSLVPYNERLRKLRGVTVQNRWIPEGEICGIFSDADLLVAPYIEASQSGVIVTAFGGGMPVVVTPVGGLVEQVRHLETGLVTESPTASGLIASIRTLLRDPDLYEHCSRQSLREVEQVLAWPAIGNRIAEVIRDLVRHQRG
jgi:glycosyltransferase involved in cell wall biosynthesis